MASNSEQPTPHIDELPGGWIETPADPSRQQSYIGSTQQSNNTSQDLTTGSTEPSRQNASTFLSYGATSDAPRPSPRGSAQISSSTVSTAVPSPDDKDKAVEAGPVEEHEKPLHESSDSEDEDEGGFTAIKPASSAKQRPPLQKTESKPMTEDDLFRALWRRRSNTMGRVDTAATASSTEEEQEEINRLLSRMFGRTRQESSEEEKTRHVGVIFKNLTVKGMGVGAALQPSVGDIFLGLPRFLKNLITRGPRQAAGKPPVRTILDDFSGCIKPGEMVLVLGRPGAGCSTFLKVIGNQRFGFEEITGEVTYGGTDAEEMAKKYRSEVLYNPEDDLHYATLKVKDTLSFALKTRTPGKNSRKEGESRSDYIREFLRVVSKLFW